MALENKETKDLFGYIRIDNFSYKNRVCSISWHASESNTDMSLIEQALDKVLDYMFDTKGIELVESSYYGQTPQKDKILSDVGMKKEAVLKQRRYNEQTNKKEDYVIYSIDIEEFNKLKLCNTQI